jgi:hypothetical protein
VATTNIKLVIVDRNFINPLFPFPESLLLI